MLSRNRVLEWVTGDGHSRQLEVLTRQATVSNQFAKDLLGRRLRVGYEEGMRISAEWLRATGRLSAP